MQEEGRGNKEVLRDKYREETDEKGEQEGERKGQQEGERKGLHNAESKPRKWVMHWVGRDSC